MHAKWLGAAGLAATALCALVNLPSRTRSDSARPPGPAHTRTHAAFSVQPADNTRVGSPAALHRVKFPHDASVDSTPQTTVASLPTASLPATSLPATSLPDASLPTTSLPATSLPATSWLAGADATGDQLGWGTAMLAADSPAENLLGFDQLTDNASTNVTNFDRLAPSATSTADAQPAYDPHAQLFSRQRHPSARECATCHPQVFAEWSVSGHAYAAISPMYHRLADTLASRGPSSLDASCSQCHSPSTLTESTSSHDPSILAQTATAQEGVTCVACHRPLTTADTSNHARSPLPPNAMPGALGHESDQPLQFPIQFAPVSQAEFCVTCHQVAVHPDLSVPLMWSQYCESPAAKEGTTCHDCHMGQVPGVANGYATGPVAIVDGRPVDTGRKHSNHVFFGPNYSIAHPGVFPIPASPSRWTTAQWLQFDWRAGWGSDPYEQHVASLDSPPTFPDGWTTAADRRAGYQQLQQNIGLLNQQRTLRRQLLENNSQVRGPLFSSAPTPGRPLSFEYVVTNLNPGHHFPTGSLDARPQRWLNVVLTGPTGEHLWESGYLDSQGNLADEHSHEVAAGRLAKDDQLVQYRTRFVTTHDDGTEHEMLLPLHPAWLTPPSASADQQQSPFATLTRPPLIRPETQSIPPLGNMHAQFRVPASALSQPGRYRLSVRMRYQSSAIYYMRICQATPEMERNMLEGSLDFHQQSFEFDVK